MTSWGGGSSGCTIAAFLARYRLVSHQAITAAQTTPMAMLIGSP